MNRHQILSGACNAGDKCYAVGSVEGVPFTAYAAGCNIVILASTFERVQIIPGATHGYIKISALDCSTDTGKIAAAYEDKVCIFEPTPLIYSDSASTHNLHYRWVQTGSLSTNSYITSLSWNLEGTRLLTGGAALQLWREKVSDLQDNEPVVVKFEIGDRDLKTPTNEKEENTTWECIWSCETSIPVVHMAFSPDGTLFATSGKNDRLVKIWYENKHVLFPNKSIDPIPGRSDTIEETGLSYSFVYIAHPRAVTHISWRKTSKYMPKGSVSNMLVTSCLDNICRIWIETVLPDDGLVNMTQFDPMASQNPKFRTHRHKHRFMQRLKHMKTCFHIRRHAKNGTVISNGGVNYGTSEIGNNLGQSPIPSLPSSYSVHDFHSYGYHGTGVSPGVHFHLAASINAETDIPLVPSMQTADPLNQPNFILHWLNNKEMYFSLQAEGILQELTRKVIEKEDLQDPDAIIKDSGVEERENLKTIRRMNKSFSQDESNSDDHGSRHHGGIHNVNSLSNTTSLNSLGPENQQPHTVDALDMKIDCLLRDWHHSPDLLFSVHPIDGSYLIWVVEWLDDYYPGSFRQAQISFSTRIPSAFPLGDAISMSTTVSLYNTGPNPLYFKEVVKGAKKQRNSLPEENGCDNSVLPSVLEEKEIDDQDKMDSDQENDPKESTAQIQSNQPKKNGHTNISTIPSPSISMVTKHSNGTLNLWQLTFAEKTKFTQVLSIGHVCRASGHRFRVNDITCHPVLPLLLTTSHHNIPDMKDPNMYTSENRQESEHHDKDICAPIGFCSELILWRVDPVGPLSHSGGVSELARINSPEISAFSNVAWIPTLLPSTTLGGYSNSPSAFFVASDGENLRVYQAVIDARTLLAEISSSEKLNKKVDSMTSLDTECSSDNPIHKTILHDNIKIVSQQSTSRPGCIIQLDPIADATHDWQNTQFLHVFQEQLITGEKKKKPSEPAAMIESRPEFVDTQLNAMVDLQHCAEFEEPFYIVIIERTTKSSTLHMWKIVIASKHNPPYLSESAMYVPDSNLIQDLDEQEPGLPRQSMAGVNLEDAIEIEIESPRINITTKKVCTQELPLPEGVDVIHASPAAGHLSSSSIYPACFAPYIIVTACSDSISRFWNCNFNIDKDDSESFVWGEWKMFSKDQDSAIEISGQPLNISAAYSGRVACAYKYGRSFTRPNKGDPESRYVNLCVAIYECESTGGSEWILEDTIHLRNIHLPRIQLDPNLDLSYLHDSRHILKKQRLNQVLHTFTHEETRSPRSGDVTPEFGTKPTTGLLAVPSFSTLQSLRKSITENGNTCPLTQKHLVQLDWVSKEDGSHILTVAVGSKILLYTTVSSDVAQANMKAMKESQSTNRPILRKASSLAQPQFNDEIRWMKLRQIDLQTADGLPPLPMQMSWVRDGILVVGMDSEMHVYSQWKSDSTQPHNTEDMFDTRNLRDEDLWSLVQDGSQRKLAPISSMPHLPRVGSLNMQMLTADKKKKFGTQSAIHIAAGVDISQQAPDYMTDYGLFQASRIACPVLPQYHPKQLMELLNSGKIRWVKAILAHLVRCISGTYLQGGGEDDNAGNKQRAWSRSRTLSMSYTGAPSASPNEQKVSTTQIPEELMLDYTEISSIPPLPLWVLLAADKEDPVQSKKQKQEVKDYDELFDSNNAVEDSLDDLLDTDGESRACDRRPSVPERQSVSHFGPRQGQLLSRLLTHTHLPGLSSLDQMHLLALADTVATCNSDFSEKFAIDAAKTAIAKENLTGIPDGENISTDSLDDCGLRFLLAMKHYNYLLRCLPLNQRNQFQKQGVATSNIVWAFHSESEEELLNLMPSYNKNQIKWSTLRELGVGWWLRNNTMLKVCMERLAKAAYQAKQDPLDAALFYLAMKKKSIVWGLYRSVRDEKMTAFFANNFNDDRWRKAALKNAFVLLGKQRFDHAVAFFLLANSLNDAIEVCLNKLEDIQLALIIARLYEGDHDITPPTVKKLLYEQILGCDEDGNNQDLSKAHPDPFLRSMALWLLKNYSGSLNTLLLNNVGQNHPFTRDEDIISTRENGHSANPNVFNFYIYLRTHPLIIRQQLALTAQERKRTQVVISGFSYSGEKAVAQSGDKQLQMEDAITSLERQLYFTTAHAHFKAGCPALALEVLSKLPSKVIESTVNTEMSTPAKERKDELINTGILDWHANDMSKESSANFMESTPSAVDMDWGTPVTFQQKEEEFKIQWDEEEDDKDEPEETIEMIRPDELKITNHQSEDVVSNSGLQEKLDIMAQQLKFVACLKILMEELSTLATGFEVDGGQLRYQLYIWLEREVDALKQLCNYSTVKYETMEEVSSLDFGQGDKDTILNPKPMDRPTLHEILLQEKQDFEAKVKRAAKRKNWLKANETLLRTLLSYCSLHGASGGGLASVRMELVLLLQELQQEKTQQQLLSPLPFPTTLPLLSACVAGNKTVIADPIKYLQSHTQDMLQTIIEFKSAPIGLNKQTICEIHILRDLAIALSSCIYQSLCDSESFVVNQTIDVNNYHSPGIENIAKLNASCQSSHLMVNANIYQRKRKYSTEEPVVISTAPSKWPGVTNLRALLAREKDEDMPKLNVLLLESFVATFMSLLVYALSTCDCHILYRLATKNFSTATWASLFGGGTKKLLRRATSQMQVQQSIQMQGSQDSGDVASDSSVWNTVTSLTKQRVKLNMKLLGHFGGTTGSPNMKEDKPTYREQFVPPEMSMVTYFLVKPILFPDGVDGEDYDTDDSVVSDDDADRDDEDVFDQDSRTGPLGSQYKSAKDNVEHSNPNSYAWSIMRLAIIKLAQLKLQEYNNVAGIEIQELPVASPLCHGILRILSTWQEVLNEELQSRGPAASDFIPGCFVETDAKGPAIHKYRSLLEKHNTPFNHSSAAAPAKRLWNYLVRQEQVQDIFIRAIFGKKRTWEKDMDSYDKKIGSNSSLDMNSKLGSGEQINCNGYVPEPIRIIHKEQESISAFCMNNINAGLMAIATPREIQEMDISLLLDSPHWFEDECEYDIMNLSKDVDSLPTSSFLVIQTPADKHFLGQGSPNMQNYNTPAAPQPGIAGQSGRGTSVIKGAHFPGCQDPRFCKLVIERSKHLLKPVLKHKVDNIKRMCAHPLMPLYLTGGQDGSVQLWEWGHQQVVCTTRPPGTFAKVTRCRFSQHGNKFGIGDGDGNLSLWQASLASQNNRSFFTYQCHSKTTTDFVFLGSSSVVASAGHSSENKNVCIWDTLLPQRKSMVSSFCCHEQGASSLIYAPQHQVLISSGKKGDICIFDVRQRILRHRFQAHESAIKCMAIDPHEELFVTGSAEGDLKVWGLSLHTLLYAFPGEHAKGSFFKHIGQGVSQLQLDSHGRLFSCGSDGSMKVRQLPDREMIVQSLY